MTVLDLTPGSPEWARRVSPSKAAGILGISPWDSQRSMWHRMRGDVPWGDQTDVMERGHLLEAGVLAWWRNHHEHTDWRDSAPLTLGDWCVATPDGFATVDGEPVLVQAKTTSSLDHWGVSGTDQVPTYYLVQVFLEAHVANVCGLPVRRIHVPVLGPRLEFCNYVVDYDARIGGDLIGRMADWYDALHDEAVDPPPLDDTVATYDVLRQLHPEIDPGAEVVLTEDQARALVEPAAEVAEAEARERAARSVVLEAMGRAQYATCNGVRIARRQPHGDSVRFVRVAKTTDFLTTPKGTAA